MLAVVIKRALHTCCPSVLRPILDRIEASEIGYRLASGTFWSVAGTVFYRGMAFVASILVARMLGEAGYGELGMIRSTMEMFGALAGFGLGMTAAKHVAEFHRNDPERTGRILGLSFVSAAAAGGTVAIVLFLSAPWIADRAIDASHLAGVLRLAAVIIFVSALNGAQVGALAGFEAFKTMAWVQIVLGVVSPPVLVLSAVWGGVAGAVWGLVINSLIAWLLSHLAVRRVAGGYGVPLTSRGWTQEWRVLVSFSLPMVLSGIMIGPVHWVCNAIVVNQKDGYSNLGVFTAAYSVGLLVISVVGMLGQAFQPMCVNLLGRGHREFEFVNILMPWGVGLSMLLPIMLFPEIGGLIFGKRFADESMRQTVLYVSLFSIIIAHRQGIARNFVAASLMWWSLGSNAFWGACTIVSTYALRHFGAEGMAGAFVIGYILNTLVFLPLYLSRGLCPRQLVISRQCLCVWVTIILVSVIGMTTRASFLLRCLVVVGAYSAIGIVLTSLWKDYTRQEVSVT